MSLQREVYNSLKEAIIYGELSPGEKLSEIELAKKMKVSRTPIREAFRQLQMEGYISVEPNKGAFVSKLPSEEIGEIYDIISLLEGYAAQLAAQKMSTADLDKLRKLQKNLIAFASQKKFREYIEENTEFHHFITRSTGNKTLAKTILNLRARIYRYRLTSITIPGYLKKYVSDHEKIVHAIAKKDSVRAREYMEDHVHFVKDILVNFLRENLGF